jgi:hypothetical protein
VRLAGTGAPSRGDGWGKIDVDPKRCCLGHDVSNLALEAGKESCALGEDLS